MLSADSLILVQCCC